MQLKIHFLNVGHGDCTIIEHPSGRVTIVDVNRDPLLDTTTASELYGLQYSLNKILDGNRQQESVPLLLSRTRKSLEEFATEQYQIQQRKLVDPLRYYRTNIIDNSGNPRPIWRFVVTHPDCDHFHGLQDFMLSGIPIHNMWDTANTKPTPSFSREGHENAWWTYQWIRSKKCSNTRTLQLYRGETGTFWNQGDSFFDPGDGISILAPTRSMAERANQRECWNLHSYVLKLQYGGRSVILGGDADEETWQDIVDTLGAEAIRCDVLKAAHHGRDSGYSQPAVKAMSPSYTIVSVGTKPDTDASRKYAHYSGNVLSTRSAGTIVVTIFWDGRIVVEKESDREFSGALHALFNSEFWANMPNPNG